MDTLNFANAILAVMKMKELPPEPSIFDGVALAITDAQRNQLETDCARQREQVIAYYEESRAEGIYRLADIPPIVLDKLPLGNVRVSLCGFAHHSSNMQANEPYLKAFVGGKDLIVSESDPLWDEPGGADQEFFWNKLDRILWQNGAPVISVDPHANSDVDKAEFRMVNTKIGEVQDDIVVVALTTACAGLGMDAQQVLRWIRNKPMSRRSFLKGAGVLALSLYTFVHAGRWAIETEQDWSRKDRFGTVATFNARDMRDVYAAYSILVAEKTIPSGGEIGIMYGGGHMKELVHYLENPFELLVKFVLYTVLFPDTFPGVRVLTPLHKPDEGPSAQPQWQKTMLMDAFTKKTHR